jgi:hypothetical protein
MEFAAVLFLLRFIWNDLFIRLDLLLVVEVLFRAKACLGILGVSSNCIFIGLWATLLRPFFSKQE